ncbi:MAG: WecB/TagA/CpsF family glycosyltransferase [Gammaproteobacteria bacterium]|nr:MAG: WecB/TagA/CpsF family glycosyltransferase [Gammaproteobacteria bacterium]
MEQNLSKYVMGVRIDCINIEEVVRKVVQLVKNSKYGYVCAANVHMLMEAQDSRDFKNIVNTAAIICPDGMPIVWVLRKLGIYTQQRITGYDITINIIREAANSGMRIGFLGGEPKVLIEAVENLKMNNENLKIPYTYSPPFRDQSQQETESLVTGINDSGVEVLFVALGCPKQEKWMHDNAKEVRAVMVGVGAVIEFLAGTKKRAPNWLQKLGLEWAYRLMQEPRRLFSRYVILNSRFIAMVIRQKLSGDF